MGQLFAAWKQCTMATFHYCRRLKGRVYGELKSFTRLLQAFFRQMERYLAWQLENSDYSAAAIWKLAKAEPVPGHEV
eukprot:SAG31_NODE_28920_length_403_cov_1.174342_1_plen_77_part_00